jgi:replicative DNA helicase
MMGRLQSLGDVLRGADEALKAGRSAGAQVVATGFSLLDIYLAGGLRSGELTLLGGPQGLGKTTFALQILRAAAKQGGGGVYVSYEHDTHTVLERMVAAEAGEARGLEAAPLRAIREAIEARDGRPGTLEQRLDDHEGAGDALRLVQAYAPRVLIQRANGSTTDLAEIRRIVDAAKTALAGTTPLVVVDYLQKVAVPGGSDVEEERVTMVVEGLKDLALDLEVPVLAIVAAEKEGLAAGKRLRAHHLRGSSALAYEPDVVLLLNDKYDVVARHHLVFDVGNAERFRSWAVLTIEKNRSGMDKIDLEFRKRFDQARFEADGQAVEEQLVDERVFVE